MRDSRGQLPSEDDTTSVRFSLTGGHGLLADDEVIARGGLVSVSLRGLGIAGPLTVRAEANGLEAAEIVLRANPAAPYRIDLVALPPTIVADRNSTTVLSAVVRDSLGNIVVDANLEIHFNISGDLAEITGPQTAMTEDGNARTILRSSIRAGEVEITATGPPGKILVFAGASGLASATFEIRVRQAQVPHFTDELPTLNLVEAGPAVRLVLSALTNDGDSNLEDLRFAVTADSEQVRLEIEGYELVATPVIRDYWGHLTATLTLRDPTGLESSAPAPVEVAWIDSLYIYSLRATDTDDNTLAYNIVEGPADMRINRLSGLLAWVPEEADLGVHEITLSAYDSQETTVQRYQLQVRRPGNPPRIGPLKGLAFAPGAELVAQLELDPLVTDPDHNDQDLLWSFAHLSGDLVSIDYDPIAQTVHFSATARFNAARIRLTVSDPDGHTAEHILRLGLREEEVFNGNATIDLDDFFRFVDAFGTDIDAPTWDGTADLNDDGQIDFDDFFV